MTRRTHLHVAAALFGLTISVPVQAQPAPATRPAGGARPVRARAGQGRGTPGGRSRWWVESATFDPTIPLLSYGIIEAARDSGFICRGCTGPMTYRITYDFRLVESVAQVESARAVVTSTSATLPNFVQVQVLIDPQRGYRR